MISYQSAVPCTIHTHLDGEALHHMAHMPWVVVLICFPAVSLHLPGRTPVCSQGSASPQPTACWTACWAAPQPFEVVCRSCGTCNQALGVAPSTPAAAQTNPAFAGTHLMHMEQWECCGSCQCPQCHPQHRDGVGHHHAMLLHRPGASGLDQSWVGASTQCGRT
jgi:hypothetical protein